MSDRCDELAVVDQVWWSQWSPTQSAREIVKELGERDPRKVAELVADTAEHLCQLEREHREWLGDVPRANQPSTVVPEVAVTLHAMPYRPDPKSVAHTFRVQAEWVEK